MGVKDGSTWSAYSGTDALILAAALIVIGCMLVYLGTRLDRPLKARRPGKALGISLVLIWVLALASLMAAAGVYGQTIIQRVGSFTSPPDPISPITALSGLVTFIAIATPEVLFMLLFFLPLFLVEIISFMMLTLSPLTRLSRYTLYALGAMFLVFAVWALFGFSYPSSAIPIALNALSKILSFVAAITLFLPQSNDSRTRLAEK
jgi:hypothetical protein